MKKTANEEVLAFSLFRNFRVEAKTILMTSIVDGNECYCYMPGGRQVAFDDYS